MGHKKRKEWPRIILCISFCVQLMLFFMLHFCQPTVNWIRLCHFINLFTLWNTFSSNPLCHQLSFRSERTLLKHEQWRWKIAILTSKQNCTQFNKKICMQQYKAISLHIITLTDKCNFKIVVNKFYNELGWFVKILSSSITWTFTTNQSHIITV